MRAALDVVAALVPAAPAPVIAEELQALNAAARDVAAWLAQARAGHKPVTSVLYRIFRSVRLSKRIKK